eukprot:CAMPEP_0201526346 /NCGR_PEP_ID=MMETSP0161_2-20130828/31561_1 /ASSEMBLY_ACC=CAM_ASM_000251 /TAXON_ID=180227 /ORGANISM="Neoparamoeba aestuarina, Strain SoJaBio B1-5/56/2" /LENGTH=93 /DNA_ID=CAMNT_0047926705 /DNA_START=573 /DNA_END=851 /DNA_ORIENTATION=+
MKERFNKRIPRCLSAVLCSSSWAIAMVKSYKAAKNNRPQAAMNNSIAIVALAVSAKLGNVNHDAGINRIVPTVYRNDETIILKRKEKEKEKEK